MKEKLLMIIDNEVTEIINFYYNGFNGYVISCDNGAKYHMFADHTEAGEAAKEYWLDMYYNDKEEFKCIVGTDNILAWAMGESAGPGYTKVESLQEWFDLWLETPEEQWASYDREEIQGTKFNNHFYNEFGYEREDIVLYRCN